MTAGKKSLLVLIAALVAVAMIGVGCSSGSGGTTSGGTTEGTVIKIGIGAPLTAGAVALGQGMERGAKLAVSQANESQEIKDAKIKLETVSGDDQGDPKVGVTVANQFASQPNLVGVMGHLNSGVSIPASKIYFDKKIVMISPASTNPSLTLQNFDNVFRVCTIDSVQGPVGAERAYTDLGFKSAVVIDDSTPYGEGLASEFKNKFEELGGKVLATEKSSDKETDFNSLVTKIKGLNPDVIYYGGIYNAGALLAKQASDAGIKAPLMGGDGLYDAEYVNLAGAAQAEGDYCTSVGLPLDQLPKGQDFKTAFEAAYPGQEIAAYDAYAYDATNVIIQGILAAAKAQGADKVATPAFRDAVIKAVAGFNGDGVTGAIAFDANGDTTNKAITLYKVTDGKWGAVTQ